MTINNTPNLKRHGSPLNDKGEAKKPHISVLNINLRSPNNKEAEDLNLSNVSDISNSNTSFSSTVSALINMGDIDPESNPNPEPSNNIIPVQHSTLLEILNKLNTIQAENRDLKKTVKTLEDKIDNYHKLVIDTPDSQGSQSAQNDRRFVKAKRSIPSSSNDSHPIIDDKELKLKVPNWGKRFHQRRNQYRNCDKNLKHAAIYSDFLDAPQPYIPKKYRPKFSRDEFDFRLGEKNSIHEMKTQKERYLYFAECSDHKYKEIDKQMELDINSVVNPRYRERLSNLWKQEVSVAEEKAEKLNEKELDFLGKLPETDPYNGFVQAATNSRNHNGGFYKRNFYNRNSSSSVQDRPLH